MLTIKSAALTHDTETIGKMDPYVKWTYAGKTWQTTVKDNAGKTPEWNEAFRLPVVDCETSKPILISAYDKENIGNDKLIGEKSLLITGLM